VHANIFDRLYNDTVSFTTYPLPPIRMLYIDLYDDGGIILGYFHVDSSIIRVGAGMEDGLNKNAIKFRRKN
jgi:hypothetical protein